MTTLAAAPDSLAEPGDAAVVRSEVDDSAIEGLEGTSPAIGGPTRARLTVTEPARLARKLENAQPIVYMVKLYGEMIFEGRRNVFKYAD